MNVYIVDNSNSASTVINFRTYIQPRAIISEDRYVVIHYHAEHYSGVNIKGLLLNPMIPMASSASAIVEVSSLPIAVGTELPPGLRPLPAPAINAAISSPQACPISTLVGGAAVLITLARPMSMPDVVIKPTSSSQSCPVSSSDTIKDPVDLPRESEQVTSPWFFLPDNKLSIVHLNIEG